MIATTVWIDSIIEAALVGFIIAQVANFLIGAMIYGKILFFIPKNIAYLLTSKKDKYKSALKNISEIPSMLQRRQGFEAIFQNIVNESKPMMLMLCAQCLGTWLFFISFMIFDLSLFGWAIAFSVMTRTT